MCYVCGMFVCLRLFYAQLLPNVVIRKHLIVIGEKITRSAIKVTLYIQFNIISHDFK